MAKITGLGGFFFRTSDPEATARWFTDVLGVPTQKWGAMFPWGDGSGGDGYTVMGLHGPSSSYFDPSTREFMLNLRVDDLDGMLAELRGRGVEVLKVMDPDPHGRFAHIMGPDGIKIELWQPAPEEPAASDAKAE